MKFSLETSEDVNHIHSYDNDHVVIKQNQSSQPIRFDSTLIVTPNQIITDYSIDDITGLTISDIAYFSSLNAEIVVFIHDNYTAIQPQILVEFSRANIGVEIMPLGAACRTYNLLVAEGRQALFIIAKK